MNKWVRSKYSEDAPRWEVVYEDVLHYAIIVNPDCRADIRQVWQDEYVVCQPPEQWEECTREVVKIEDGNLCEKTICTDVFENVSELILLPRYRWVWQDDTLVIERRVRG